MLYFLKLCYFHIFIPLQCLTFFSHVEDGSQEHLLVFHKQTQIKAALVSLMPFNNVSRVEYHFQLIFIAINYSNHDAVQGSDVQTRTEPPKSKQQFFKAQNT